MVMLGRHSSWWSAVVRVGREDQVEERSGTPEHLDAVGRSRSGLKGRSLIYWILHR